MLQRRNRIQPLLPDAIKIDDLLLARYAQCMYFLLSARQQHVILVVSAPTQEALARWGWILFLRCNIRRSDDHDALTMMTADALPPTL